jgi:hypothetical protein
MTISKAFFGIFLLLNSTFALAESVVPGTRFVSPDGRYSVELTENKVDRLLHFVIKDFQTGHVSDKIVMPTALLYLHWSANSQAIVTVEHIAHGSYGRIIHFKRGTWRSIEIKPPSTGMSDVMVVNLEIRSNYVHFKFAVRDLNDNNVPIRHRVCDIDVSLTSGRFSNVKCVYVSPSLGAITARQEPSYQPAMKLDK